MLFIALNELKWISRESDVSDMKTRKQKGKIMELKV